MVEIRPSRVEELEQQKRLWKAAFGDDEAYIDLFYNTCARPEDVLILSEDGQLCSMAALLPLEIALPGGGKPPPMYTPWPPTPTPASRAMAVRCSSMRSCT